MVRLNGFLKAIKHYKLDLKEEWILNGNFTYQGGMECAKMLSKQKEIPTAVFCSNDLSALGFLNEIKRYGIKVPEDISIIGFDNIYASQYSTPPLTTIRQPIIEMGKAAAELLLTKIHNKDMISQGRIFPVNIIERDSVKKI